MKKLLIVMLMIFLPVIAEAGTEYHAQLLFAPPHNEPAFRNDYGGVSRYVVDLGGTAQSRRFKIDYALRLHGQNQWKNRETVGNGLDAWSGSDWSVDRWVRVHTIKVTIPIASRISIVTESVMGDLPYYHLFGFRFEGKL